MQIQIPQRIYNKVMHWVMHTDSEVSGLGTLERVGDDLVVTEAILLPQVVGGAHTDIEPLDASKVAYDFHTRGLGAIRWWWHSHVDMQCFWSKQDHETMALLGEHGWIGATVFNRAEESRSALYMGQPLLLFADEIDLQIMQELPSAEETAKWDEEYAAKVKEKPYGLFSGYTAGVGYVPVTPGGPWATIEEQIARWQTGENKGRDALGRFTGGSSQTVVDLTAEEVEDAAMYATAEDKKIVEAAGDYWSGWDTYRPTPRSDKSKQKGRGAKGDAY